MESHPWDSECSLNNCMYSSLRASFSPTSLELLSDETILPCWDWWLSSEFFWSWCLVFLWALLDTVGRLVGLGCRTPLALLTLGDTFWVERRERCRVYQPVTLVALACKPQHLFFWERGTDQCTMASASHGLRIYESRESGKPLNRHDLPRQTLMLLFSCWHSFSDATVLFSYFPGLRLSFLRWR
jgi:hypothetical protein